MQLLCRSIQEKKNGGFWVCFFTTQDFLSYCIAKQSLNRTCTEVQSFKYNNATRLANLLLNFASSPQQSHSIIQYIVNFFSIKTKNSLVNTALQKYTEEFRNLTEIYSSDHS